MKMSLKQYVINANRSIVREDRFIKKLRTTDLTREQFRLFAAQRAYIATNFIKLLEKGVILAKHLEDEKLALTLQSNLNDELGLDEFGNRQVSLNHGQWKSDYLKALNIKTDEENFPLLSCTKNSVESFIALEESENLYQIAGAILSLENIIPLEYRAAVVARDKLFPEVFCIGQTVTDAERVQQEKVRRYMDDHIIHDSKSHFPELLEALAQHENNEEILEQIQLGINYVNRYRKQFYEGLDRSMAFGSIIQTFYTIAA